MSIYRTLSLVCRTVISIFGKFLTIYRSVLPFCRILKAIYGSTQPVY